MTMHTWEGGAVVRNLVSKAKQRVVFCARFPEPTHAPDLLEPTSHVDLLDFGTQAPDALHRGDGIHTGSLALLRDEQIYMGGSE